MFVLCPQHAGTMEAVPGRTEQRPPNILGAGDDGAKDHDRSHLQ